jgi:hypothetical protein
MTPEERSEKARAFFQEMVSADPSLVERQIYQYIKNCLPESTSPLPTVEEKLHEPEDEIDTNLVAVDN